MISELISRTREIYTSILLYLASRWQNAAPEASCQHQVSLSGELLCIVASGLKDTSPKNSFWSYRLSSFLTESQEFILKSTLINKSKLHHSGAPVGHHLYDPVACLNTSSHGSSIYMQKKRKRDHAVCWKVPLCVHLIPSLCHEMIPPQYSVRMITSSLNTHFHCLTVSTGKSNYVFSTVSVIIIPYCGVTQLDNYPSLGS